MDRTLAAAALIVLSLGACGTSRTGETDRAPLEKNGSGDSPAEVVCPLQGGAVSTTADSTWLDIDPGSPLIPVRFKLPPGVEGKRIDLSPTEAIYMVKVPGGEGLLQLGVDRVQKASDFAAVIREQQGTATIDEQPGSLGGKPGTEVCGTLSVPLPFAVVQRADGGIQEQPAHVRNDRYGGFFVPIEGRVFRATYRLPEQEAAQWEPVFKAILASLTWT